MIDILKESLTHFIYAVLNNSHISGLSAKYNFRVQYGQVFWFYNKFCAYKP